MKYFYSRSELKKWKRIQRSYRTEWRKDPSTARQYAWDHVLTDRRMARTR